MPYHDPLDFIEEPIVTGMSQEKVHFFEWDVSVLRPLCRPVCPAALAELYLRSGLQSLVDLFGPNDGWV